MRIIQEVPLRLVIYNSLRYIFACRIVCVFVITLLISILIFGKTPPATPLISDIVGRIILFLFAILVSGLLVLHGRFTTWVFDKENDSFLVRHQLLFFNRVSRYDLKQIKELQAFHFNEEDSERSFSIRILLENGYRLFLSHHGQISRSQADDAVRIVSNFLDSDDRT